MIIHNLINQSKSSKDNGYPYILLFVCGIDVVSMYNLGMKDQKVVR